MLGLRVRAGIPPNKFLQELRNGAELRATSSETSSKTALYSVKTDDSDGIVVVALKQIFGEAFDSIFNNCPFRGCFRRYCFRRFVAHRDAAIRRSHGIHSLI